MTVTAPSELQVRQMTPILMDKLARRKNGVRAARSEDSEVALRRTQQKIMLRNGIYSDCARRIAKMSKDSRLKVQASIRGEQVRLTGKKRDDLQAIMQLLKTGELDLPLQFRNFRDSASGAD